MHLVLILSECVKLDQRRLAVDAATNSGDIFEFGAVDFPDDEYGSAFNGYDDVVKIRVESPRGTTKLIFESDLCAS